MDDDSTLSLPSEIENYKSCVSTFNELETKAITESDSFSNEFQDLVDRSSLLVKNFKNYADRRDNTAEGKRFLDLQHDASNKLYFACKVLQFICGQPTLHSLLTDANVLSSLSSDLHLLRQMWGTLATQMRQFVFPASPLTFLSLHSFGRNAPSVWGVSFLDVYGTNLSRRVPFDKVLLLHFFFSPLAPPNSSFLLRSRPSTILSFRLFR